MGRFAVALELITQARQEERRRACRIIRELCQACEGTGVGGTVEGENGEVITVACEYCGRPIRAIMEGR